MIDSQLDQIHDIIEQPIVHNNSTIGWQSIINNKTFTAFSGGTSSSRDTSRRIAFAEFIERVTFSKLVSNKAASTELILNEFPSSSCFAAGFDNSRTRFRAICEGLERWAWSKWIDEGFPMSQYIPQESEFTELAKYFRSQFDKVYFFKLTLTLKIADFSDPSKNANHDYTIGIVIAEKANGVFAGSRVTTAADQIWEHGLIEAYRNLRNQTYYNKFPQQKKSSDIIALRSHYFGENKHEAFKQIPGFLVSNKINPNPWPEPKIRLLKEASTGIEGAYLWRCLMHDFIGWDKGAVNRFVY